MYCPKCKDTFEEGSRRFCPTDGSRLIPEAGVPGRPAGGIFSNLIPKIQAVSATDENLIGRKSPVLRQSPPPIPALRMGSFQPTQLVVAVDRDGAVRYVWSGGPFDALPTVAELLALFRSMGSAPSASEQAH